MALFRNITRVLMLKHKPAPIAAAIRRMSLPADPSQDDSTKDLPVNMENPYKKERRLCILCKMNITPDYKNYKLLSQFQSPFTGRIYGRHITGLCENKQKLVEEEITKAQNCAYMPYYTKERAFLKDPRLFDPERPIKPHRFM